jgi:hypothetical protein
MDRRDLLFVAGVLASFVSLFLPMIIIFVVSGKDWKAAQERERQRRLTDAKMNAILLRMNI